MTSATQLVGHWMLPRRGVAPRQAHFVAFGAESSDTHRTASEWRETGPTWKSIDGVDCVAASAALRATYPVCLDCAEKAKDAEICC